MKNISPSTPSATRLAEASAGRDGSAHQGTLETASTPLSMVGVGHELRTPLGALSAALEVISLAGDNAQVRNDACAVAARQTRLLSQMVDDLQDVLAAKEGRLVLRTVPLDFSELVRAAWESLVAAGEGHSSTQHIAPHLRVMADSRLLRKAIEQIFLRARKAAASGVCMDVSLTAEGDEICLQIQGAVSDSPQARSSAAFDIRVQAGTHVSLLDLLTDDVIQLHGGRIAATAEGGSPAVWLPRWDDAPQRTVRQQHVSVLVAFQDPLDRLAAVGVLEQQGYRVLESTEKKAPIETLLKHVPDLVVVDAGAGDAATGFAEAAREAGYAGRMIAVVPAEAHNQLALNEASARRAGFDVWTTWDEWPRVLPKKEGDRH